MDTNLITTNKENDILNQQTQILLTPVCPVALRAHPNLINLILSASMNAYEIYKFGFRILK